jgi:hypothetical protein
MKLEKLSAPDELLPSRLVMGELGGVLGRKGLVSVGIPPG